MQKEIPLSYFPKITTARYRQLITNFGSLETAWTAGTSELQKIGWEEKLIHEWQEWKNELDEIEIAEKLSAENIHCITINDPEYSPLLRQIYDPPFCLFVRGKLKQTSFPLAVVGTRKYSAYGKMVTEALVPKLVRSGFTIVSGLALGIDAIAHATTLDIQGYTIAVLGAGVDRNSVYPRANYQLSERIIESGGALISEYPPGSLPTQYSFPRRNRIIAGLSKGVLVAEAAEKSGALITAQCVLDYGREVFAIPHNINSLGGFGPNALIKTGAHPVTDVQDILDVFRIQSLTPATTKSTITPSSPTESALCTILAVEPTHIDKIIKESGLPSNAVMSTLTIMEIKGMIVNLGGMMYAIKR